MSEKMIKYETIFARSFSRYEQKRLTYGAFLAALVIALSFCTVFVPYLITLQPVANLSLSIGDAGLRLLRIFGPDSFPMPRMINDSTFVVVTNSSSITSVDNQNISTQMYNQTEIEEPLCNIATRSDYCELKGDIRISGKSSTVFIASSSSSNSEAEIRPYARKTDAAAMDQVTRWSIKSTTNHEDIPQCTVHHSVPAVLFSSGGYAGNNFHDFSDIVIPLYVTSRPFNGQVKFLVADRRFWWVNKFPKVLKGLSRYDLIDIDKEDQVHCFSSVIIGLKRHPDELKIEVSQSRYSMKDFREFLRRSYNLKKKKAIKIDDNDGKKRPRLLILARNRTRSFTNLEAIFKDARRLGFRVVVAEADSNVAKFARIVNSCDVMMGVHGAGLTNMVFLPENAVLIQVVPIGEMQWMAATIYGEPAKGMDLRYLEYMITAEESSLREEFRNPKAFKERGWEAFYEVYMVKQNVKVDVDRFRPTLLQALQLLHDR